MDQHEAETPPNSAPAESAGSGSPPRAAPQTPANTVADASAVASTPEPSSAELAPIEVQLSGENVNVQLAEASGVETTIAEDAPPDDATLPGRIKTMLIGKPLDLGDKSLYHSLSLIAFFAWVGLGSDGLSSSAYGPAEAFRALLVKEHETGLVTDHSYLAVFLALATVVTVFIISACYSHIIEEFPSGGGGYLVATKLLGRPVGLVAGCALLVDYVLTITVSIAAMGDALFGLIGKEWQHGNTKLYAEAAAIGLLIVLNLRGLKESIKVLLPIFLTFLATHVVLIVGAVALNVTQVDDVAQDVVAGIRTNIANPSFGLLGMLGVFFYAYSLGAGTYTGIEAVSNSMQVMHEPRVATGKRTMLYMAVSLALTAGGLILGYLLLGIKAPVDEGGPTMNLLLTQRFMEELGAASWTGELFIFLTILSEGALLVVAGQAGFIGGPRMLANMAQDSWVPHWFANLSERLTTHNGIMLMGLSALAALLYAHGNVSTLLVMYSINVFVTFSLSMLGMCRHWWRLRDQNPVWRKRFGLFAVGATMCLTILTITVLEKFKVGGWVTIGITGVCVVTCWLINLHYRRTSVRLKKLDQTLGRVAAPPVPPNNVDCDHKAPTAAILVGGYSGLGIHTMLNAIRFTPNYYKNIVFLSVGVVDSGNFKGARAVDELKHSTETALGHYVDLARALGMPATSYMAMGTDAVDELEHLCLAVAKEFPRATFFAGQLVFQQDTWYHRLLHNQTAFALQRRLHFAGTTMVILPTRVK